MKVYNDVMFFVSILEHHIIFKIKNDAFYFRHGDIKSGVILRNPWYSDHVDLDDEKRLNILLDESICV